MTLTLTLPDRLEKRLLKEAALRGYSATAYVQRVLEDYLEQETNHLQAVALLQSWIDDGDSEEQQETGRYLIEALDKDRLSDRKLFPPEMKGVTW